MSEVSRAFAVYPALQIRRHWFACSRPPFPALLPEGRRSVLQTDDLFDDDHRLALVYLKNLPIRPVIATATGD
jgi:hypothetical protein